MFRGKGKYSGEWIYGIVYCKQTAWKREKTAYYNGMFITTGIHYISGKAGENEELEEYEVIPETVGQYTGLTDKNGKKIFEGDIVKVSNKFIDYVVFDCGCFNMERQVMNYEFTYQDFKNIEVIGNIYDNPELLKENDND